MVIPKPLCTCRVCREARAKGFPYERTEPSAYLHDLHLLIDAPAEVAAQLNRAGIGRVDFLIFTHLDPDHVEGFRIVEQIALDFRTWRAYPEKSIRLLLPKELNKRIGQISTWYGLVIDFYQEQGFVEPMVFKDEIKIGEVAVKAVLVDRDSRPVFIYVFEKNGRRIVYAPCDLKPFPVERPEVQAADLLVIQPGLFETGLKHGFAYPEDHISRTTLYTFEQTLELARQIRARRIVFTHLEEYWNRSYDDYLQMESRFNHVHFAHDGMEVTV